MATLDSRVNSRSNISGHKSPSTPVYKQNPSLASSGKAASGVSDGFQKGQVLKGEVIDLRNKDVKIQLDDSRVVHAKMEEPLNLSIGDRATFLVTKANYASMTLKMMSQGNSGSIDHILEKALDEARLPHTDRNISAVRSLLMNKLPINASAIQLLLRQSAIYKNASLETLAIMNKLDMPLNQVNTTQFEAYRNYEHRLVNQLELFVEDLLTGPTTNETYNYLLDILSQDGQAHASPDSLHSNQQSISTILTPDESGYLAELLQSHGMSEELREGFLSGDISISNAAHIIMKIINEYGKDSQELVGQKLSNPDLAEYETLNQKTLNPELTDQKPPVLAETNLITKITDLTTMPMDTANEAAFSTLDKEVLYNIPDPLNHFEVYTVLEGFISNAMENTELTTFLSPFEREQLANQLGELVPSSPEVIQSVRTGELPASELLPLYDMMVNSPRSERFTRSQAFQSVMKKMLTNHFTLSVKDLLKPKAIDSYYARLEGELSEIEKHATLRHGVSDDAKRSMNEKPSGNVRDNISFMKTLNQIFSYFQMPLNLRDKNVHSELYVYTNKKSLLQNKDRIMVLLHLDMPSLGPVDVHVELNKSVITTKFYVESDDSGKIVTNSLPQLTKDLAKKGYTHYSEVLSREKAIDIVEDFIILKDPSLDIKRYTFDIRA